MTNLSKIRSMTISINNRFSDNSLDNYNFTNEEESNYHEALSNISDSMDISRNKILIDNYSSILSYIINNKLHDSFILLFKYLNNQSKVSNYNKSKIKSMIDECLKSLMTLDSDTLAGNYSGLLNSDILKLFSRIDNFIENYKMNPDWEIAVMDYIQNGIKNKQNGIRTLFSKYDEIIASVEQPCCVPFIFNSIIYCADSKNIIHLLSKNGNSISDILKDIMSFFVHHYGQDEIADLENNIKNYIYINKDMIDIPYMTFSSFNLIVSRVKNLKLDEIEFEDNQLETANHISSIINDSLEYLSKCSLVCFYTTKIEEFLYYIINNISRNEILNFISGKLEDYPRDCYFNPLITNIKYLIHSKVNVAAFNYIQLEDSKPNITVDKSIAKEISLKEFASIHLPNMIRYARDCAIIKELYYFNINPDNINIFNYIINGTVAIPFACSMANNKMNGSLTIGNGRYTVHYFQNILYIQDNRYYIREKDLNIVENCGIEFSTMSAYITMMEDFTKFIEDNEFDINEANLGNSISNKVKIWSDSFKSKLRSLKDTDHKISSSVDNAADKLERDIKDSFTSKNRDAIIKGRLIPSFSQFFKVVLASGAIGVFTGPLIGALSFLGAMAVSHRINRKEREKILDEIDVKIKVVEKRISKAEEENNMKDYEDLLKVKKVLEAERTRILYKIKDRTRLAAHKDED